MKTFDEDLTKTFYIGVGYCFNKPKARVARLLKYGKRQTHSGFSDSKVPSILAYAEDSPNLKSVAWGFEADPKDQSCRLAAWFKLFFQRRIDIANWHLSDQDWALPRGIMHLPEGKTPTDLVSEFLHCLFKYFTIFLGPRMASKGKKWELTKIKFCFTVPVVWSLEATNEMASAIKNAGIGTRKGDSVCFLTEAEAAMTFLLSKRLPSAISRDSNYGMFKVCFLYDGHAWDQTANS